jgi:hypothetical protein
MLGRAAAGSFADSVFDVDVDAADDFDDAAILKNVFLLSELFIFALICNNLVLYFSK